MPSIRYSLDRCRTPWGRLVVWCLMLLLIAGSAGAAPQKNQKKGKTRTRATKSKAAAVDDLETGAVLPQFLGVHRDNVSPDTGLADKWPSAGPKYLGVISGLGVGFSNFSSADGIAYTMGNFGEREKVVAVQLADGKPVWDYDLAGAYHNSFGDGPRSTPTLDGDRLYAIGASGDLVCLNRATGERVWQKNIVQDFKSGVPNWGICESVLIDGDRLICTPGGPGATLVALDKSTGSIVWSGAAPDNDRPGYSSILPIEVGGVRQYVQFTASGVVGLRASDGKFLWRDNSSANGTANCAAPVFADNMVFTSSGYGKGASMVELSSSGDQTAAKLGYHSNDLKVQHGGLVLVDGHVYGSSDSGGLMCLELSSGKKKWSNRSVGKGSVTCADGKLFIRDESEGKVAMVKAAPDGYKELGRFEQKNRSNSKAWTYPVVFSGKLFLRDQDEMHIYDLQ